VYLPYKHFRLREEVRGEVMKRLCEDAEECDLLYYGYFPRMVSYVEEAWGYKSGLDISCEDGDGSLQIKLLDVPHVISSIELYEFDYGKLTDHHKNGLLTRKGLAENKRLWSFVLDVYLREVEEVLTSVRAYTERGYSEVKVGDDVVALNKVVYTSEDFEVVTQGSSSFKVLEMNERWVSLEGAGYVGWDKVLGIFPSY